MKPFNLEEAKAGKPVCTRSGKPVRIICYNIKGEETYPILALITTDDREDCSSFTKDGKFWVDKDNQSNDLMMVGEKHEGYINLYHSPYSNKRIPGAYVYNTKEQAIDNSRSLAYITTTKIEWEE